MICVQQSPYLWSIMVDNDGALKMEAAFDRIWDRIETHEGEMFLQTGGMGFSYEFEGCHITINENGVKIPRSEFYQVFCLPQMNKNDLIAQLRAPYYTRAIMKDRRIKREA